MNSAMPLGATQRCTQLGLPSYQAKLSRSCCCQTAKRHFITSVQRA